MTPNRFGVTDRLIGHPTEILSMDSIYTLTGILALGILVAGPFLAGCASTPIYFDEVSNGKTISITQATSVTIRLKENPTTGFSWVVTLPEGLSMVDDKYAPDTVPAGIVGSGGTHIWTLRPDRAGTFTFRAVHMQPWMNVTGTEQTYTLTLMVK
jgi:inhibitor of cysteine peptidase